MGAAEDMVRALAARRGVDLDALAAASDVEPFNQAGWRMENPISYRVGMAERTLAYEAGLEFELARMDHPSVAEWVRQHVADQTTLPWLLLMGETGRGKTYQAWGALREVVLHLARRNRSCRWRAVAHAELNAAMRPKPDESHAWVLEAYERAEFLLFDDLGAGSLTDFAIEGALRLVDHRYKRRLPTIYTTNLDIKTLKTLLGDRIVSRLLQSAVVLLDGPDRRVDKGVDL